MFTPPVPTQKIKPVDKVKETLMDRFKKDLDKTKQVNTGTVGKIIKNT